MRGRSPIQRRRNGWTGSLAAIKNGVLAYGRSHWHKGYAIEAAKTCKQYAFAVLKADEVCSIIRDTNKASQTVAERNGMTVADTWTKHYRGVNMPHFRYVSGR